MKDSVIHKVLSVILALGLVIPVLAIGTPVVAQEPPSTPTNPRPGSTSPPGPVLSGKTVTLEWDASPGTIYYMLWVYDANTETVELVGLATGTSYTATLQPDTPYWWVVNAHSSAGTSPRTNPRYFRTSPAKSDLTLTTYASWDAVWGGGDDWYISVENGGDIAADDVILTVMLDDDVQAWEISDDGAYDPNEHSVRWNLGSIPPGSSREPSLTVLYDPMHEYCIDLVEYYFSVITTTPEYSYLDNEDHIVLPVYPPVQIGLDLWCDRSPSPGSEITFTAQYYNYFYGFWVEGMGENVVITNTLSDKVDFISASGNGIYADGQVTWLLGSSENLEDGAVTVTVRVRDDAPVGSYLWHDVEVCGVIPRIPSSRCPLYGLGLKVVPKPSEPDLWISEIKPVQVTWSPDIDGDGKVDLVAGKATMVRVHIGMKDHEELPEDTPLEVELVFDGHRYWKPTTIGELQANKHVDFYPYAPTNLGDQVITATVDPPNWIQESDETNNDGEPIEISVKDTTGLYLYYIPIDEPRTYFGMAPGYGPVDMGEFSNSATQSGKFISATYPVAEGEFTNIWTSSKYYGDPIPFVTSIIEDAIGIWLQGEWETLTRADISVGIVPVGYFTYHLDPECPEEYAPKGIRFPGIDAVIATVGYWTAPAHEVGHAFGDLRLDKEEYHIEKPGKKAEGFWVAEHREISNGACFMGKAGAYDSFNHRESYDERPIWICDEDYAQLFRKVRVDPADPDMLLVSGMISKNGTVELGRFFMVENGQADPLVPGDYSIEILDTQGQVLMNIPFHTAFKAYLEPYDILDIDYAGFTLAIPYSEATSRIRIQHNGENLIEVNPNTKLLHDAVDSIPDHGYINNPDQRRNALHNKIDALEKMIERGGLTFAMLKLERDVKCILQKWLVDDYSVESPLQLTKVEVISLVQTMIERLVNQSR